MVDREQKSDSLNVFDKEQVRGGAASEGDQKQIVKISEALKSGLEYHGRCDVSSTDETLKPNKRQPSTSGCERAGQYQLSFRLGKAANPNGITNNSYCIALQKTPPAHNF